MNIVSTFANLTWIFTQADKQTWFRVNQRGSTDFLCIGIKRYLFAALVVQRLGLTDLEDWRGPSDDSLEDQNIIFGK